MAEEDPEFRTVEDVARDLKQARDAEDAGRGRAVFLVGAGCSKSAGIPTAEGVAQFCARALQQIYESVRSPMASGLPPLKDPKGGKAANEALEWLMDNGHIEKTDKNPLTGSYEWGAFYSTFFEDHLKAPNVQREIISHLVEASKDRLNWTHACLGELVALRIVHTILTTNFDPLVLNGMVRAGVFPVIADGFSSFNRIVGRPAAPQVVHLHGSMHTYNLRNSRRAITETKEDQGTLAMVHTLLQQCNVLIIIGYAGGEEGLMEILHKASERLEELVIYWVVYKRDDLTKNCRKLMKGRNKFIVDGGDADEFFFELMSALGAGPPKWIRDPLAQLVEQRDLLIKAKDNDYISDIIVGYSSQIDRAAEFLERHRQNDGRYHEAASRYAEGDYDAVLELLRGAEVASEPKQVRLRATAALDQAKRKAKIDNTGELEASIDDFTALLNAGNGNGSVDDLLSLIRALELLSEQFPKADARHAKALTQIGEAMRRFRKEFHDRDETQSVEITLCEANARFGLLSDKDQSKEGDGEASKDSAELREKRKHIIKDCKEIEKLFRRVINLAENADPDSKVVLEAREGLAGTRQIMADHMSKGRGEEAKAKALRKAWKAVEDFERIAAAASRSPASPEDAGVLHNLAHALKLKWQLSSGKERDDARLRGQVVATKAAEAFGQLEYARLEDQKRRDVMLNLLRDFWEG